MLVSARTGEGVEEWRDWLAGPARAGTRVSSDRLEPRRRVDELLEHARARTSGSSRSRPTASRGSATGWPSALRAAAVWSRSASPAARSDVRHVAVEFVHPVIVGKRALPAIGFTGEGGPLVRRST